MEIVEFKQPPTLNELVNTARLNKFKAASEKKRWTNYARDVAIKDIQNTYTSPFIAAEISYKRSSSDLDNLAACFKPILDGLVIAEVLSNDCLSVIKPVLSYRAVKIATKEANFIRLYLTEDKNEIINLILKFYE